MNEKYEKIINLPHHTSKTRQRMSLSDRAAQFAPYSALSGYEDAVEETARLTDQKAELDEYEKEKINSTLNTLLHSEDISRAKITFFRPDRYKSGGAYVTVAGEIAYVDEIMRTIALVSGAPINLDDIFDIQLID